jgi:hypothetical protein
MTATNSFIGVILQTIREAVWPSLTTIAAAPVSIFFSIYSPYGYPDFLNSYESG